MIPIKFPESNKVLVCPDTVPDCDDLHVWTDGERLISCWKLSFLERLEIFLFGKLWVSVFHPVTHPPIGLMAGRNIFSTPDEEKFNLREWWSR